MVLVTALELARFPVSGGLSSCRIFLAYPSGSPWACRCRVEGPGPLGDVAAPRPANREVDGHTGWQGERFTVVDIVEIYVHWYAGRSKGQVSASLGVDQKTVRKYLAPAEAAGITPGGPPMS